MWKNYETLLSAFKKPTIQLGREKKIFTQQGKFSEHHIMEKYGMEVETLSSRQNVD